MDTSTILELVKARLGISTTVRDTYLTAIINSAIKEISDEKGLLIDASNYYHLMFVVDYVAWRYQNRDSAEGMPRHLQYRLHNLIIHIGINSISVTEMEFVDVLPLNPVANTVYILPDNTKQIYIDTLWVVVNLVNGLWVRV